MKNNEKIIKNLQSENDKLSKEVCDLQIEKIGLEEQSAALISQIDTLTEKYNKSIDMISDDISRTLSFIEPLKDYDKQEYMKQYNRLISEYADIVDTPETIYDVYSAEQINIMLRCIETETYQAPFDAKVNVASVILNRVEHEWFPEDPIKIITAPKQFCYHRTFINPDTALALEYAFSIEDTTDGCVAFRSDKAPKVWGNFKYSFTDEVGHNFYK
jgi:hypothetical protein